MSRSTRITWLPLAPSACECFLSLASICGTNCEGVGKAETISAEDDAGDPKLASLPWLVKLCGTTPGHLAVDYGVGIGASWIGTMGSCHEPPSHPLPLLNSVSLF